MKKYNTSKSSFGNRTVRRRTLRRNRPKNLYCCLHFELIVTSLTKQSISKLIIHSTGYLRGDLIS